MAREFATIDLANLSESDAYELLTAAVTPRPIALVSTVDGTGAPNLAPFSYFTLGGTNPPSVLLSATLGDGGYPKRTLKNILETGEFVLNSLDRGMAEGMIEAANAIDPSQSEWRASGFTPSPSHRVRPSRVAESLIQMECRLHQVVEHGSAVGAARYVIGEVLVIHLAPEVAASPGSARLICRLGGRTYFDTAGGQEFSLAQPVTLDRDSE